MSTQSGALGLAILDYARRLNIGISSFVSVGNKTDVSSNDLIQYWSEDPNTSVILLYLESFGNPRKFSEIARRVGRTNRSWRQAGAPFRGRAASSHTGALAGSDKVVDALFQQAASSAPRRSKMFDVAASSHQPIRREGASRSSPTPRPGILAADACGRWPGAAVLSEATRQAQELLPPAASVTNPSTCSRRRRQRFARACRSSSTRTSTAC
jgi:acyl-CoA synthetase (NDP forming)